MKKRIYISLSIILLAGILVLSWGRLNFLHIQPNADDDNLLMVNDADGNTVFNVGTSSSDAITITGTLGVSTSLNPDAADGATLGTSALEWSDIYLASGGVIYFQNDQSVTITGAAAGVAFSGSPTFATAANPDASDGATLGTTSLEWSDLFLADGAALGFGDDQDVTFTHQADAGVLLNSTNYVAFNATTEKVSSSSAGQLDLDAATEVEIAATTIDINGILDLAGAQITAGYVVVTDGNYTILAANSGKTHILPNATATDTLTLPAEAAGLTYRFIYGGGAEDAQNHMFDSGANANYFIGGLAHLDLNAGSGGDEVATVYSDGNSNSKMTIITPGAGTEIELVCDGTHWYVFGQIVSDTVPTFADQ